MHVKKWACGLVVETRRGVARGRRRSATDREEREPDAHNKQEQHTEDGARDRPVFGGEFDPGSGSTLAACLMHASRARTLSGVLRGGRVRNTWATCPGVGDSRGKPRVIPHTFWARRERRRKTLRRRPRRGLRPISWTVGSRPTVAMIGSWSERTASHTGTETRPRLLREAAARNLPQWGQP